MWSIDGLTAVSGQGRVGLVGAWDSAQPVKEGIKWWWQEVDRMKRWDSYFHIVMLDRTTWC